jgi:preprotein translocase subunit SecF
LSRFSNLGDRLYTGEISYDFVGQRKKWYVISAVLLIVTLAAIIFRGLNLGIEFQGGAKYNIPSTTKSVAEIRDVFTQLGQPSSIVKEVGGERVEVQIPPIEVEAGEALKQDVAEAVEVAADSITVQNVGPSWGADITRTALIGLGVFIILVSIFLAIYFEFRMAIAALIALAHDLILTIGVYAIGGFEVTPATVIGVLTIMGYSLYDTVVIFDKVKENTRGILGQSRFSYQESANLAVNQTLIRSLNTSLSSVLPTLAILIVGAGILRAGTLVDLALALFVGMLVGTYSSIFVAVPALVHMKEQQPEIKSLENRVRSRRKNAGIAQDQVELLETQAPAMGTTTLAAGPRSQPKRAPRSKRKKS